MSLVAKAAHTLTSSYHYSQSEAWKQAHAWEGRRVKRINTGYIEKINKQYRIINQIDLFKNKNQLIHFLNIITAMNITVKRNGEYLELYVNGKFDAYVFAINSRFAIQLHGTTINTSLKSYVKYNLNKLSRIDGGTIPGKVESYERTYK